MAHDTTTQSFVLLYGDWDVKRSKELLDQAFVTPSFPNPEHVVVELDEADGAGYHLLSPAEVFNALRDLDEAMVLADALGLEPGHSVPTISVAEAAQPHARPAIVVDPRGVVAVEGYPMQRANGGGGGATRGVPGTPRNGGSKPNGGDSGLVTSTLVAEFPSEVQNQKEAVLLVSLSTLVPATPEGTFTLHEGDDVDLLVQAKAGFELVGDELGSVKVTNGETDPVLFKLRAVTEGDGDVRVLAFHRGQHVGKVRLTPTVVTDPVNRGDAQVKREGHVVSPPYSSPDLMLFIEDSRVDGGIELEIRLTSADGKYNVKRFGPVCIAGDPQQYFAQFFGDMENIPLDSIEQRLAAQGSHLFTEMLPEDLRQTLWSLRDSVKSIMVQSEEGTIPWELCKLHGKENGQVVEGPFLCEAYAIARWVPETDFRSSLTAQNIALVVPGDSNLPAAVKERDYIHSLKSSRAITDVPATYSAVHTEFAAGKYDVWHFTGHGLADHSSPDRSRIVLEGGDGFRPQDLSGVVTNLGRSKPIVFLNACQSSVGGPALTGIGGWGRRFVDAGAGAFLGTYWSVSDPAAAEFAECFYDAALGGKGVAEAAKDARLAIKDSPGPTWLAYTVMADPLATVA